MPTAMSFSLLQAALLLLLQTSSTLSDATYRSRPDLSPPHFNITVPATSNAEKGFLFVAPFTGFPDPTDHGPLQAAPYIMTDTGDLVWSGFTYFSIWAGNFQVAKWKGQDVLFAFEGAHNSLHGHGHGHHTFLDDHYRNIRELRAGNHMLSDKHEFIVVNEETALIQIYHPLQKDLSAFGAKEGQTWIVDARFQELNIETGEVLFEWSSLDCVSPNETSLPLVKGQAGSGHNSSTAWDYFHINSITKDSDGHYLLSARHASTLFKINGTDGSIIWRLGGAFSSFALGPDVDFGFQHHARYLPSPSPTKERISLFDNSIYGSESAGGGRKEVQIYPYSRGKYIELDYETMTANLVQAFRPPGDLLVKSQGSLQTLPNSNVLINWGSEGAITEFTSSGKPIFHAFLESGTLQENLQNYRAFRYNWTGVPDETPAVVAEYDQKLNTTNIYVSWNGDTQTAVWRFYSVLESGESVLLGEKERVGFETVFCSQGMKAHVIEATAVSGAGSVLTRSDVVKVVNFGGLLPKYDTPAVTSASRSRFQTPELLVQGEEL